jgi:hypothetical protein
MPTIINGTTGIDKVQDDSVDIADLSATGTPSASTYLRGDNSWATVSGYTNADALTLFNASGSAPVYACRAWVNFNGTGTVAIRGSGNVSSITDNGTGDYTVNFSTAMPDTNYCCSFGNQPQADNGSSGGYMMTDVARTTSAIQTTSVRVRVADYNNNNNLFDALCVFATVFR